MSFTDFSDVMYFKVFDTGEEIPVGDVILSNPTEVKHIRTYFYKQGTLGGNEQLQLKVYSDSDRSKTLYTSEVLTVSDIDDPAIAASTNWLGKIRFDFSPEVSFNENITYYISIESTSYTRDADNFYLGCGLDTPVATNSIDSANPPILLEIYGVN